jgi:hypothetical protein
MHNSLIPCACGGNPAPRWGSHKESMMGMPRCYLGVSHGISHETSHSTPPPREHLGELLRSILKSPIGHL